MGMLVNPYRHATGADDSLVALFANGEIGDYWRFDNVNTDQSTVGGEITAATGLVNGRVLEDANASHTPNLQIASGKYYAAFDGSIDRLFHNFGSTVAQPGTIILCLNHRSTVTNALCTGSSTTSRWQISCDSGSNLIAYAGTSLDSTQNGAVGLKVIAVEFNGASTKFRINGTQTATGNAGTQSTDRFTLGALWDGTAGCDMFLYSALFINRLLTTGTGNELDTTERLMGADANLTW